MTYRVPKS